MKSKFVVVLLCVGLFAIQPLCSQNVDRIQRGQRGYTPPPLPQGEKAISIDNTLEDIDQRMDVYEAEFSLDAFEKAVMKNFIVEFEEGKMNTLRNENMEYGVKLKTIKSYEEKLATELEIFLTQDEIGRFGELHFVKENRKLKKKKKDKKEDKKGR